MNDLRIALFLSCSVFTAPYFLTHDLVALSVAAAALAAGRPPGDQQTLALKAVYLLPMLQMAAGMVHVPGVALVPIWFAVWALRRLRSAPAVLQGALAAS
jgi:hypothetical protein